MHVFCVWSRMCSLGKSRIRLVGSGGKVTIATWVGKCMLWVCCTTERERERHETEAKSETFDVPKKEWKGSAPEGSFESKWHVTVVFIQFLRGSLDIQLYTECVAGSCIRIMLSNCFGNISHVAWHIKEPFDWGWIQMESSSSLIRVFIWETRELPAVVARVKALFLLPIFYLPYLLCTHCASVWGCICEGLVQWSVAMIQIRTRWLWGRTVCPWNPQQQHRGTQHPALSLSLITEPQLWTVGRDNWGSGGVCVTSYWGHVTSLAQQGQWQRGTALCQLTVTVRVVSPPWPWQECVWVSCSTGRGRRTQQCHRTFSLSLQREFPASDTFRHFDSLRNQMPWRAASAYKGHSRRTTHATASLWGAEWINFELRN